MSAKLEYESARQQHPTITLSYEAFERAFEVRGAPAARGADVFVGAAIEARDPAALEWLVSRVRAGVRQVCTGGSAHLDDVESKVIGLIAVGTDAAPPRISSYAARGPLEGWLRVFIARVANELRPAPSGPTLEAALSESVNSAPELVVLRRQYGAVLKQSLSAAIQRSEARGRSLLALHYLEGVGLGELGRLYGVHPATISRWLLTARQVVFDHFRDEVARLGNVERLEVESLVRAMRSHLDVSWGRLLEASGAGQSPAPVSSLSE